MSTINKNPVSAQLFEYIKNCITTGEWKAGEKIPSENSLTSKLNVSRSALREVLQQFTALGVLKSYQGKGTFVQSNNLDLLMGSPHKVDYTDVKAIKDILQYRLIVEPQSLKLALGREPEQIQSLIAQLEELHESMISNVGRSEPFIDADVKFHLAIARASGNVILESSLTTLFTQTFALQQKINTYFGFRDGLHFHEKIIKALKAQDYAKAVKELKHHLQYALDELNINERRGEAD